MAKESLICAANCALFYQIRNTQMAPAVLVYCPKCRSLMRHLETGSTKEAGRSVYTGLWVCSGSAEGSCTFPYADVLFSELLTVRSQWQFDTGELNAPDFLERATRLFTNYSAEEQNNNEKAGDDDDKHNTSVASNELRQFIAATNAAELEKQQLLATPACHSTESKFAEVSIASARRSSLHTPVLAPATSSTISVDAENECAYSTTMPPPKSPRITRLTRQCSGENQPRTSPRFAKRHFKSEESEGSFNRASTPPAVELSTSLGKRSPVESVCKEEDFVPFNLPDHWQSDSTSSAICCELVERVSNIPQRIKHFGDVVRMLYPPESVGRFDNSPSDKRSPPTDQRVHQVDSAQELVDAAPVAVTRRRIDELPSSSTPSAAVEPPLGDTMTVIVQPTDHFADPTLSDATGGPAEQSVTTADDLVVASVVNKAQGGVEWFPKKQRKKMPPQLRTEATTRVPSSAFAQLAQAVSQNSGQGGISPARAKSNRRPAAGAAAPLDRFAILQQTLLPKKREIGSAQQEYATVSSADAISSSGGTTMTQPISTPALERVYQRRKLTCASRTAANTAIAHSMPNSVVETAASDRFGAYVPKASRTNASSTGLTPAASPPPPPQPTQSANSDDGPIFNDLELHALVQRKLDNVDRTVTATDQQMNVVSHSLPAPVYDPYQPIQHSSPLQTGNQELTNQNSLERNCGEWMPQGEQITNLIPASTAAEQTHAFFPGTHIGDQYAWPVVSSQSSTLHVVTENSHYLHAQEKTPFDDDPYVEFFGL